MSTKQAKLMANAHKHNLLNSFCNNGYVYVNQHGNKNNNKSVKNQERERQRQRQREDNTLLLKDFYESAFLPIRP